jgi:hypothetical protein
MNQEVKKKLGPNTARQLGTWVYCLQQLQQWQAEPLFGGALPVNAISIVNALCSVGQSDTATTSFLSA